MKTGRLIANCFPSSLCLRVSVVKKKKEKKDAFIEMVEELEQEYAAIRDKVRDLQEYL